MIKTKAKATTAPLIAEVAENKGALVPHSIGQAAVQVVSVIERAISNPKLDVKKMQAIMDMQMQAMRFQAEIAYNYAMNECQGEIPQIRANKRNDHTKSGYANLSAIDVVIRPILKKYGFSLSFSTKALENGNKLLECWVRHVEGHKELHTLDSALDLTGSQGKANKTNVQATGSTVSYLQRYLIKLIFNVVIEGEDNDGNGEPKPPGDKFSDKVAEQSGNVIDGMATRVDDDKAPWDGTINYGKNELKAQPFTPAAGHALLVDCMKKHKSKANRLALINANLALVRALVKANQGSLVSDLHKLADEGMA